MNAIVWVFGFALTCLPLAIRIWITEGEFQSILNWSSYWNKYADVYFIAVAIGGVAIAEMVDLFYQTGAAGRRGLFGLLVIAFFMLFIGVGASLFQYALIVKAPPSTPDMVGESGVLIAWATVCVIGFIALSLKIVR